MKENTSLNRAANTVIVLVLWAVTTLIAVAITPRDWNGGVMTIVGILFGIGLIKVLTASENETNYGHK